MRRPVSTSTATFWTGWRAAAEIERGEGELLGVPGSEEQERGENAVNGEHHPQEKNCGWGCGFRYSRNDWVNEENRGGG